MAHKRGSRVSKKISFLTGNMLANLKDSACKIQKWMEKELIIFVINFWNVEIFSSSCDLIFVFLKHLFQSYSGWVFNDNFFVIVNGSINLTVVRFKVKVMVTDHWSLWPNVSKVTSCDSQVSRIALKLCFSKVFVTGPVKWGSEWVTK